MNSTFKKCLVYMCVFQFIFITNLKAKNIKPSIKKVNHQHIIDSWPLFKSAINWYTLYGNDYTDEKSFKKGFYANIHYQHEKLDKNQYDFLRRAFELVRDDWIVKKLLKTKNNSLKKKSKQRQMIPFKYG